MLKDYPEQIFNETQKLLSELQKLPDFKLSESMPHKGSQGKIYLTASEVKEKRKPKNLQEANFCRETFYY